MLSNLQAGGHALMQIFLLGQPEFRNRLADGQRLEQLRQRVIAMHHLEPMGVEEVGPYMIHRMTLVGWSGTPNFTEDAFAVLHRASRGLPRELNQLAARVLLHGAMERLDRIDARVVETVIADLAVDMPQSGYELWQPQPRRAVAPVVAPAPAEQAKVAELPAWLDLVPAEEAAAVEAEPEAELALVDEPQATALEETTPVDGAEPAEAIDATTADEVVENDEPAETPVATASDPAIADLLARIAGLEARVEEQDAALRRVLTLLVDWVEGEGQRPDIASLRTRAA